MKKNQNCLAVMWLFVWGVAIASQRVREWWVVSFTGTMLLAFTWVIGRLPVAERLSLKPVSAKALILGILAGSCLFLIFFAYLEGEALSPSGHVNASIVVSSILIAPVTEDLIFRGITYRGFQSVATSVGGGLSLELFGVLLIAIMFGVVHQRSSIFLAMTIGAGILYGLLRWRFHSI